MGYMDYLTGIDKHIFEKDVVETKRTSFRELCDSGNVPTKKSRKKSTKKNKEVPLEKEVSVVEEAEMVIERDVSVDIIEDRMRTKLEGVGLNDKVINEVVSYVLANSVNITGLDTTQQVTVESVESPTTTIDGIPPSIRSRAEDILGGGAFVTPNPINEQVNTNPNVRPSYNMNNVADHASALL